MFIFFGQTPIYLSILVYLAKNCELSEKMNIKIFIIKKSQIINSYKTVSQFSIKAVIFLLTTQFNDLNMSCTI